MSQTDPFADAGFLDRLGKLLPMLGSSQAPEADTARRKLLEHLAQHRLSLTDVATRLRDAGPHPAPGSPREAELLRELDLVRHARIAAEHMAQHTLQQNAILQHRAVMAERQVRSAYAQQRGSRVVLVASCAASVLLLLVVLADHWPGAGMATPGASAAAGDTLLPARTDETDDADTLAMGPGDRLGTVLSNDIAVRAGPRSDAVIKGFLPRGTEIVVVRAERGEGLTWLLIRSRLGAGFVPDASVSAAP